MHAMYVSMPVSYSVLALDNNDICPAFGYTDFVSCVSVVVQWVKLS